MGKIVLGIFAHPDDAEIVCAGTLSLLKKAGWTVHIASMTPGDKGSAELSRKEISKIRKNEAAESARLLNGKYHCLEFDDIYIFYKRKTINKTIALIRKICPSIVFTASPNDYMADHEITARIVQTACFSAGIKNMKVKARSFEPVPYLFYSDPPTPDEYRRLTTRIVDLHPITCMQNTRTSAGGVVTGVPVQALTVGPVQTWKAEKVSIWHAGTHDNPFGQRLTALMLSKKIVDSSVPMSLLADHPDVQFNYYRGGIGVCETEMH